jgi:branched-chain amino acid transport system permease protein
MDWIQTFNLTVGVILDPLTAAYILCAIGLSVHFGFTGLLNFGQAAFAAVGAYGMAIGYLTLKLPLLVAMGFALLCVVLFALILGVPTLRLRADYLAIVTIAASEVFRYLMSTSAFKDVTGGSNGLSQFGYDFFDWNPIPDGQYNFGPFNWTADQFWLRVFSFGLVGVATLLVWLMMRSPWGRVLKGIREDEDAVRSLGKNVFSYKLQSLIIGGLFAGMGGIVFVLSMSNVQPQTWVTNFTFMVWTVLLLGGAASMLGPIAGGMVFFALWVFVNEILAGLASIGWLPFLDPAQVGQVRFILIGLALMLLVIFRPQGMFGNKKELRFNG